MTNNEDEIKYGQKVFISLNKVEFSPWYVVCVYDGKVMVENNPKTKARCRNHTKIVPLSELNKTLFLKKNKLLGAKHE